MPWKVFKTGPENKPFCVFKVDSEGEKIGESLGCHTSKAKAVEQIQAIGAASHAPAQRAVLLGTLLKAIGAADCANVGDALESKVHLSFTWAADMLFGLGFLNREERIGLSSAIGTSLDALNKTIDEMGLQTRPLVPEVADLLISGLKTASIVYADGLSEAVVCYGGQLKAIGDGRVGGYLVLFSDGSTVGDKDLTGEWFTKNTNYHWAGKEKRPALYHHGLDPVLGKVELGNGWKLGRIDDVGLWVETQLKLRHDYEAAIYHLTNRDKMGLSSGTASHMIAKNASGEILNWFIAEGSFTPTPAEPKTMARPLRSVKVVPLKTLLELPNGLGAEMPKGASGPKRVWGSGNFDRLVNIMRQNKRRY